MIHTKEIMLVNLTILYYETKSCVISFYNVYLTISYYQIVLKFTKNLN